MGLFDWIDDINNEGSKKAKEVFGALDKPIGEEGFLSNFRWYDLAGMAAAPMLYPAVIGARAGLGAALKDAELPVPVDQAVGGKAPPAPDFTDAMVQLAAKNERDRISGKQGRRSAFVTGQDAASTFLGSY